MDDEETFGPVATIYRFDSEEEIIKRANDVPVGLGSYIFTKDVARTFLVSEALEVGMVGVNCSAIGQPTTPFGGVKETGFGREGGPTGIEEYIVEKTIVIGDVKM